MLNALPHIKTHLREGGEPSTTIIPKINNFGKIATRIPLPAMTSQKHVSTLLVTNIIEGGGMPHLPFHVHCNWEIKASLNMGPTEEIKW
jgi:hypothetical protein